MPDVFSYVAVRMIPRLSTRMTRRMKDTSQSGWLKSSLQRRKPYSIGAEIKGSVNVLQENVADYPEGQRRRTGNCPDAIFGTSFDESEIEKRRCNTEGSPAKRKADIWDRVAWDGVKALREGGRNVLAARDFRIECINMGRGPDNERGSGIDNRLEPGRWHCRISPVYRYTV